MILYLLPIERIGYGRGPRYLKWKFAEGLDYRWSLKDFGHTSEIGLAATDHALHAPDALQLPVTWSQLDRDRVGGYLRSAGIEHGWVEQARDWREAWQRLAGLTQVYQSAMDDPVTSMKLQDPSVWLGRRILFGFDQLTPLDMDLYRQEQIAIRKARQWRIGDWLVIGREWVNQVTGRVVPVIAGGALPATDVFTTGADAALATYSANWSMNTGAIQVLAASDDFRGNSAGAIGNGFHNVETYDNDQYSQVTISAISDAAFIGAASRCGAAGVDSFYFWQEADTSDYLGKHVTGTETQLGSSGAGGAVSDTMRLETESTTIRPKRNGSVPGTPGEQTDSSLSSGKAGINSWNNSADTRGDDFEGGNLVVAWDGFPSIDAGASTNGTTLSGGVALNMPGGTNELLIAICGNDNPGTTNMGMSGWTEIFAAAYTSDVIKKKIFGKLASGTDSGTLTGASQDYVARVLRISNHGVSDIATDIKVGTVASGSSNAPNPTSLDAGSSKKWMWIAVNVSDDDDNTTPYAPTNYTPEAQVESAQSTSSCMVQVAWHKNETQTEDPGAFALAATEEWLAVVIAIPPEASVVDPYPAGYRRNQENTLLRM